MSHDIISIEAIERQAKAAAQKHTEPHEACPYPLDSDAAARFKQAFLAEKAMQQGWITPA